MKIKNSSNTSNDNKIFRDSRKVEQHCYMGSPMRPTEATRNPFSLIQFHSIPVLHFTRSLQLKVSRVLHVMSRSPTINANKLRLRERGKTRLITREMTRLSMLFRSTESTENYKKQRIFPRSSDKREKLNTQRAFVMHIMSQH